jgi:hypothetical protein
VDPAKEVLVGSAGQHSRFERLGIDLQEIDQMLVKADGDVVVILNQARVPEMDLVNESSEMRDAADESFRTPRIGVLGHGGPKHTHGAKKSIGGQKACATPPETSGNGSHVGRLANEREKILKERVFPSLTNPRNCFSNGPIEVVAWDLRLHQVSERSVLYGEIRKRFEIVTRQKDDGLTAPQSS